MFLEISCDTYFHRFSRQMYFFISYYFVLRRFSSRLKRKYICLSFLDSSSYLYISLVLNTCVLCFFISLVTRHPCSFSSDKVHLSPPLRKILGFFLNIAVSELSSIRDPRGWIRGQAVREWGCLMERFWGNMCR